MAAVNMQTIEIQPNDNYALYNRKTSWQTWDICIPIIYPIWEKCDPPAERTKKIKQREIPNRAYEGRRENFLHATQKSINQIFKFHFRQ